jgi:hypothetical protein
MTTKARKLADLGNVYDDGALSNRNVIVNGGMTISQRSTGSTQTGTGGSYVALDRWELYRNSSFTPNITVSQSTDAPSGFLNSMKVDVDATDTPTGSENFGFRTKIEGLDTGRFNRGTASAENMTLSFYVKSNKTGTYSIQLYDMGATIYSKLVTYTIDAVDTWERKEITVQANTNSNSPTLSSSEGLRVAFDLGSGPDDVVPIFDWNSTHGGATRVAAGQVNLLDSTSNYWQITGVQLEVGDTATPFEHRSYGDELARCQRYYYKIGGVSGKKPVICNAMAYSTNEIYGVFHLPVPMRTIPSGSYDGLPRGYKPGTAQRLTTFAINSLESSEKDLRLQGINIGYFNAGDASWIQIDTLGEYLDFDAEL